MKYKHRGAIGVALAGLALLIITGQLLWAGWNRERPRTWDTALDPYVLERLQIDPEAVRRMDLVEPTLETLVRLPAAAAGSVVDPESTLDFAMFGKRPPGAPVLAAPYRAPAAQPRPHPYRVAMTYVSGDHRYAVIDSKLYQQNELLPHGESLAEVADGAVRLDSASGQRWIAIDGAGGR